MKRFLVFKMDTYYPCGGWEDYIGQADTKEEAVLLAETTSPPGYSSGSFWHVVDTLEGKICAQS